jgi:hypothetical protein
MTFAEFQASRRAVPDVRAEVPDETIEPGASGLIYGDGYFILDVMAHWPEAARERGRYYLIVCNEEWISDDLEKLERELFSYAADWL